MNCCMSSRTRHGVSFAVVSASLSGSRFPVRPMRCGLSDYQSLSLVEVCFDGGITDLRYIRKTMWLMRITRCDVSMEKTLSSATRRRSVCTRPEGITTYVSARFQCKQVYFRNCSLQEDDCVLALRRADIDTIPGHHQTTVSSAFLRPACWVPVGGGGILFLAIGPG
jgi:hypothetical protein